jgi:hypothetical protein
MYTTWHSQAAVEWICGFAAAITIIIFFIVSAITYSIPVYACGRR